MDRRKTPVAVLGPTGIVGQTLVRMLDEHPLFELAELVGSERRAGARYGEADGALPGDPPPSAAQLRMADVTAPLTSPLVLSALPSGPARDVEPRLARAGHVVCTNASALRPEPTVPLIIPEANSGDLVLVRDQPWREAGGAIVANPNCMVAGLVLALGPIHWAFGLRSAVVVTLQALSGAGLGGAAGVRVAGNVVPHIPSEADKIPEELEKILGWGGPVAVAVNRVPVVDGHMAHVFLRLERKTDPEEVTRVLEGFEAPQALRSGLPSLPRRPIHVHQAPDRPQPRLDASRGSGMVVTVGQLRKAPSFDVAFSLVVHNGVRGAAGACLANAELCLATGLLSEGKALQP